MLPGGPESSCSIEGSFSASFLLLDAGAVACCQPDQSVASLPLSGRTRRHAYAILSLLFGRNPCTPAPPAAGYDERDPAVMALMGMAIDAAVARGKYVGICGQAPSDFPEVTQWLVERGIGCAGPRTTGLAARAQPANRCRVCAYRMMIAQRKTHCVR